MKSFYSALLLFVRGADGLRILDLLSDPDGATKGLVERACACGKVVQGREESKTEITTVPFT